MDWEYKIITPKIAEEMLLKNNRNRHLSQANVERLAGLMKNGQWPETGHTIQIYEDGNLADGQTRLAALVRSGCSYPFLIAKNVKLEAALAIDANRPRSVTDCARIGRNDPWFNSSKVAVIRFLYMLKYPTKSFTSHTMLDVLDNNPLTRRHIDYAYKSISKQKGFGSAPFIAAVATAYAHESRARLDEFCSIVNSGCNAGDKDNAAVLIREFGLRNKVHASYSDRKDYFLRTQNAIKNFCDYKHLSRIMAPKSLIYPVFL